jgi:predicted exporter
MVPLVAALAVLSTVLTLGGNQLTMFHLVGMLLVVGVGSNYTLFFEGQGAAGGFFERKIGGGDPQTMIVSLVLCNASTAIGFGLLALARAPVLSAIGVTVAVGAFLSLAFSAVLARRGAHEPQR